MQLEEVVLLCKEPIHQQLKRLIPGAQVAMAFILAMFSEGNSVMMDSLLQDLSLTETTLYFRHYLFEAYYQTGRIERIREGFAFWNQLIDKGLLTPVERHEPSRSDCHAWSSHPLFHLWGSLLGIRPQAPGFREISIKPQIADLGNVQAKMPHPKGSIHYRQIVDASRISITVRAPESLSGQLRWHGKSYPLERGELNFEWNRKSTT